MYAYKEKDKKSDKQYQPTSHLSSLINQLTLDMSNKTIPCGIKNPKGLLQSLLRLQNIVGMHSLKENIAKQTSYLIQKMATNDFNMNMLNTTLYGNPGTGKTTVGVLLAEIWHHLGFLQTATNKNINIYNLLNTVQFELLQVYIMV